MEMDNKTLVNWGFYREFLRIPGVFILFTSEGKVADKKDDFFCTPSRVYLNAVLHVLKI